jgi:hypothetical protein
VQGEFGDVEALGWFCSLKTTENEKIIPRIFLQSVIADIGDTGRGFAVGILAFIILSA